MQGRETSWRQGTVLTADASRALLGGRQQGDSRLLIVVSHDCDLSSLQEDSVEVIAAIPTAKPEPTAKNAQHPRRLDLRYVGPDQADVWLSLRQGDKFSISRDAFIRAARPDVELVLTEENKRVLKQWLAARYGRPAFPDSFEARLRTAVSGRPLEKRLRDIVAPCSDHLVALLFDLGEERNSELPEGEAYGLSITLVYDSIEGGPDARRNAEACENPIKHLFEQAFGPADEATGIILENCVALADAEVSLADLRRVDVWRFEYLSLDEENPAPVLPRGELPT